jgi:hypothetical protein
MSNAAILLPALNVQVPWSALLLSGSKTVETRGYALPSKYVNVPLLVVETPGSHGRTFGVETARSTGILVFSHCFQYSNEEHWKSDVNRHRVEPGHPLFGYVPTKPKWGWVVAHASVFPKPEPAPLRRGIVFTSAAAVPEAALVQCPEELRRLCLTHTIGRGHGS